MGEIRDARGTEPLALGPDRSSPKAAPPASQQSARVAGQPALDTIVVLMMGNDDPGSGRFTNSMTARS
jgi:hypothetical protein